MIDLGLKMKNIRNRKRINSLIATVKKDSVVLMVIERIKEALIHRELKPGDYLPSETELTKNLGVGKSSVREAIKMLQAMGVLEVRRGQGTMIRKHLNDISNNFGGWES
jgi:GntR family transcriptional repressor for pyruvate dehydrogenase complex